MLFLSLETQSHSHVKVQQDHGIPCMTDSSNMAENLCGAHTGSQGYNIEQNKIDKYPYLYRAHVLARETTVTRW